MITLNTEKGFVRIESWDDITSRPGFTTDIDPRTVQLQAIIGNYVFADFITCGLSTCHQPHGSGYLVSAKDGRETNIGKDCGKKHFSVDFVRMRNTFTRDLINQERRERLGELKNRLPSIIEELGRIKNEERGATWVNAMISKLSGKSGNLPTSITEKIRKLVRTGSGTLTIERKATKQEADIARLAERRQNESDEDAYEKPQFVEEQVGFLEGFAALLPENSLRTLLLEAVEPGIKGLEHAEIINLNPKELGNLHRLTKDLESSINRIKESVVLGRRLLVKDNISQLYRYIVSSQQRQYFTNYLNLLPTDNP